MTGRNDERDPVSQADATAGSVSVRSLTRNGRSTLGIDRTDESIRILHVDDEPAFLRLAAEYMESTFDGFEVHTETSAPAALERLEAMENDIDCVVSDLEMPEMDGLEFLDSVRTRYPDLPFMLMTGQESETIVTKALEAGVTDYLQKDVGTTQFTLLANRIENAVERHRIARRRVRPISSSTATER